MTSDQTERRGGNLRLQDIKATKQVIVKAVAFVMAVGAVFAIPAGAVWYVEDRIEVASTLTKIERRIELTELEIRQKTEQLDLLYERERAGTAHPTDARRKKQLEKFLEILYERLEALTLLL